MTDALARLGVPDALAALLCALVIRLWPMAVRAARAWADGLKDARIREAARAAIAGAEEWGAREAKHCAHPTGGQKRDRAISAVRAQFPKVVASDVARVVEEEVARMPGVGATGTAVGAPVPPVWVEVTPAEGTQVLAVRP